MGLKLDLTLHPNIMQGGKAFELEAHWPPYFLLRPLLKFFLSCHKLILPKSSVEVDISLLIRGLLLISIDFALVEAFRSLDCNSFFSVSEKQIRVRHCKHI